MIPTWHLKEVFNEDANPGQMALLKQNGKYCEPVTTMQEVGTIPFRVLDSCILGTDAQGGGGEEYFLCVRDLVGAERNPPDVRSHPPS